MLVGRAGRGHEELVAARTVARTLARIFRSPSWALALGWRRRGSCGQLALPPTHAVAPALLPAALLTLGAGAVALAGPPTPPPAGRLPTAHAAIATLRPPGPEPAFATLEQATPAAVGTGAAEPASLTRPRKVGKLLGAHGRKCSRVVKSRGEVVSFPPRRLYPSPVGVGEGARVNPPVYPAVFRRAPIRGREPVCARPSANRLPWLCQNGSLFGCH
jgi:hypothetical protein